VSARPRWNHGGVPGLRSGHRLIPSPPHVHDGCAVCAARAAGRSITAGEMRGWARTLPNAADVLQALDGAPDDLPIDPPAGRSAVYITTDALYATWYAARSAGDHYEVRPIGDPVFPSYTVPAAVIIGVLRRRVRLTPRERDMLLRRWREADDRSSATPGPC
jgi:hypothetical protein